MFTPKQPITPKESNHIKYFTQFGDVFKAKLVGYNIIGIPVYENINTGHRFLHKK